MNLRHSVMKWETPMRELGALAAVIGVCLSITMFAAPPVLVPSTPTGKTVEGPFTEAEQKQFAALDVIDTHTHIFAPSPVFTQMTERLNLHMVDILVMDNHGKKTKALSQQRARAMSVINQNRNRVRLCTTFNPYKFGTPDFAEQAVNELDTDFANGAIAVKIWKKRLISIAGGPG